MVALYHVYWLATADRCAHKVKGRYNTYTGNRTTSDTDSDSDWPLNKPKGSCEERAARGPARN